MDRNNLFAALATLIGKGVPAWRAGQQQNAARKLQLGQLDLQNQRADRAEARQGQLDTFSQEQAKQNQDQQDRSFYAGQVERSAASRENQAPYDVLRANPLKARETVPIQVPTPNPTGGNLPPSTINPTRLDIATSQAGPTKVEAGFKRQQILANTRSRLAEDVQRHMQALKDGSALDRQVATHMAKWYADQFQNAQSQDDYDNILKTGPLIEGLIRHQGVQQPPAETAPSATPGQAPEPPPTDFLQGSRLLGPSFPQKEKVPLADAMGVGGFRPLPQTPKQQATAAGIEKGKAQVRQGDTRNEISAQNADKNAGRLTETKRHNKAAEGQQAGNAKDISRHRKAVEGLIGAANGIRSGTLDETKAYHALDYGLNTAKHNLNVWRANNPKSGEGVPFVDKQRAAGIEHRVQAAERALAAEKRKTTPDLGAVRDLANKLRDTLIDQKDFLDKAQKPASPKAPAGVPYYSGGSLPALGPARPKGIVPMQGNPSIPAVNPFRNQSKSKRQQYIDAGIANGHSAAQVRKKANELYGTGP